MSSMCKGMSILMISQRFLPSIGGVEKHIRGLSSTLSRIGYETTVLTWAHARGLPTVETADNIKIVRIPHEYGNHPVLGLLWVLTNRRLLGNPRLVHIHDPVPLFYWYLPLRVLWARKPVFMTFHGFESDPPKFRFVLLKRAASLLVDGTMCIGTFLRSVYRAGCEDYSPGAVDTGRPGETREGAVFVGRLERDTGILEYIEALMKLRVNHGHRLTLVVCGSGSLEGEILSMARDLGVTVDLRGKVEDPSDTVGSSRVSFAAGYLSILEAMAAGTPVVGVARSHLKMAYLSFVRELGGPISVQSTSDGVAREVARLLDDEQMWHHISKTSRAFATRFTWEYLAGQYVSLWSGRRTHHR
ncbi:MAG: glycosyltransferase family 4 protein [Candidatus Thorarchaeota archaeon]